MAKKNTTTTNKTEVKQVLKPYYLPDFEVTVLASNANEAVEKAKEKQ